MGGLLTVLVAVAVLALVGLGLFLAREQAAGTTPTQAPTTTTRPATSTPPAVQAPAPDAAFNTDYNGAAAARPR
jgi:hypothetical protein